MGLFGEIGDFNGEFKLITFAQEARAEAWKPTRKRLLNAFRKELADKLPEDVKHAPASIAGLLEEIGRMKRWMKGMTPGHVAFIVAGLIGVPVIGIAVQKAIGEPVLTALFSVVAAAGTVASSLMASFRSMHDRFEKEQAVFDAELTKKRETRGNTERERLEQRLRTATIEEREELSKARAERHSAVEQARENARDAVLAERLQLEDALSDLEAAHTKKMGDLEKRIKKHERVIGLTAGSPNLNDLIRSRAECRQASPDDGHLV